MNCIKVCKILVKNVKNNKDNFKKVDTTFIYSCNPIVKIKDTKIKTKNNEIINLII